MNRVPQAFLLIPDFDKALDKVMVTPRIIRFLHCYQQTYVP